MRKLALFLVAVMFTAIMSGCILSSTPPAGTINLTWGQNQYFTVTGLGGYQWYLDNSPLMGETKASYIFKSYAHAIGTHQLKVLSTSMGSGQRVRDIKVTLSQARLIETDNAGDALNPQVATSQYGNAIAVWEQWDGTRYNIWANRLDESTWNWGTAQLIETDNVGNARDPQIAMDQIGDAIAVWTQYDGTTGLHHIWANRYTPTSRWGIAGSIESAGFDASNPQVAMDMFGNAIAVYTWSIDVNLNYVIAERYTPAGGWAEGWILQSEGRDVESPQIAMDQDGDAIAVWAQDDGTGHYHIWANRYTGFSDIWGGAGRIEGNAGTAYFPQVAMDQVGNAVAVWAQYDGTRLSIWANRYRTGSVWGTAELIETDNACDAYHPQIAMDPVGNAVAVWSQAEGVRSNIWANRYTTSSGWGTAGLIETDNTGDALSPQVAIDPSTGNAIAVWEQDDGTRYNIWANQLDGNTYTWGMAQLIETDNTGDAYYPQIAMDPLTGIAVAVWCQRDYTPRYNIWAYIFKN
jgi:hypothetical protein